MEKELFPIKYYFPFPMWFSKILVNLVILLKYDGILQPVKQPSLTAKSYSFQETLGHVDHQKPRRDETEGEDMCCELLRGY